MAFSKLLTSSKVRDVCNSGFPRRMENDVRLIGGTSSPYTPASAMNAARSAVRQE